jgi:hypothetical protein
LSRPAGADIAARAGYVLDKEILAGLLGKFLRDQAREQIGRSTRRKSDDDLDRT